MNASPAPKSSEPAVPNPFGVVHLRVEEGVAAVRFDRPDAHNAMTWAMYEQLAAHCKQIAADRSIRVVTFRGTGAKAFVAGTDIAQFAAFQTGEDGLAYEQRIEAGINLIERLPVPTLAVLDGWVIGGGLVIAAACDLRVATPAARFGVPIARTLGNCLSAANMARLVAGFGVAGAKRMLLLAETLSAEDAAACGFVARLVDAVALDDTVRALCGTLAGHAPLTMLAAKETIRRVLASGLEGNDDLIRQVYGSADFKEGVASFVGKRAPQWQGR